MAIWVCRVFDTLMQEFYRIVQGKNEKVQTSVFHLERALKAIKHQHTHAMIEEEGVQHLKDHLFHGLKPNLCSTLHYIMINQIPNTVSW